MTVRGERIKSTPAGAFMSGPAQGRRMPSDSDDGVPPVYQQFDAESVGSGSYGAGGAGC